MERLNKKNTIILVTSTLVILCIVITFFIFNSSIELREISNESTCYTYCDLYEEEKSFLIKNCPDNREELYNIIYQFYLDNYNIQSYIKLKNEIKKLYNVNRYDLILRFYKVSFSLPWNWQGRTGFLFEDSLDSHKDDYIGFLYLYKNSDDEIELYISVKDGLEKYVKSQTFDEH